MSKDRPNKSFRINSDRPFKTYNPNVTQTALQYSDPRRLQQILSIPTAAALIRQHRYGQPQQQQDRQFVSNQLNHSSQPRNSSNFQQNIQNQHNFQDGMNLSTNFNYDVPDLIDSETSLLRHVPMTHNESAISERGQDLNISSISESSHLNPHPIFVVQNVNMSTSGSSSLTSQAPSSSSLNTSMPYFSDCLTVPINTAQTESLSTQGTPQFVHSSSAGFYNIPTSHRGIRVNNVAVNSLMNMSQCRVKQEEVDSENTRMMETFNTKDNLLLQNQMPGSGLSKPVLPITTREMSSCSIPMQEKSRDLANTSRDLGNTSTHTATTSQELVTNRSQDRSTTSSCDNSSSHSDKCTGESSKDSSYLEKRRKNNDSAKRSREARRTKEEMIALHVIALEEENMRLRAEFNLLDKELGELQVRLLPFT